MSYLWVSDDSLNSFTVVWNFARAVGENFPLLKLQTADFSRIMLVIVLAFDGFLVIVLGSRRSLSTVPPEEVRKKNQTSSYLLCTCKYFQTAGDYLICKLLVSNVHLIIFIIIILLLSFHKCLFFADCVMEWTAASLKLRWTETSFLQAHLVLLWMITQSVKHIWLKGYCGWSQVSVYMSVSLCVRVWLPR